MTTKTGYILGIVGYRYYNDYDEFSESLSIITDEYGYPKKVISGGHLSRDKIKQGTDTLAWKWATDNSIPITEHEANWNEYGRAAGPIRNKLIVRDSDILIAFVSPKSKGTLNTIKLANEKGIPVIRIDIM